MALAITNVNSGGTSTSNSSLGITTFAGNAGDVLVVHVGTANNGGTPPSPTLTQTGAVWVQLATDAAGNSGTRHRITTFITYTVAGYSTSLATLDYAGAAQNGIHFITQRVTSGYLSGTTLQASRQSTTSQGGTGNVTTLVTTLANAYSHANNLPIVAVYNGNNDALNGMASWTSIGNTAVGNNIRLQSWTTNTQELASTVTHTTGVHMCSTMFEVREASDSASGPNWANKIKRASKSESYLAGV